MCIQVSLLIFMVTLCFLSRILGCMKEPDHKLPFWIWPVYLFLFALSIPWYLPDAIGMILWWGLPLWLVCSISAILLIAIFTIWVIQFKWGSWENSEDKV